MQVSTIKQWIPRLLANYRPAVWQNTPTSFLRTTATMNCSADISLPEKPKRPVNIYLRFVQKVSPSLREQNPKVSTAVIAKLAAEKWRLVDADTKAELEKEYKQEQVVWLQQNAHYLNQLTEDQKDQIRQMKTEKMEEKTRRETKKRAKGLGKPKRPLNSFLLYCNDNKPATSSKEDYQSNFKALAKKWAQMTDMEKQPYVTRAAEENIKYRKDISQWEEKMMAQDNFDLVRRRQVAVETKKEKATKKQTRP